MTLEQAYIIVSVFQKWRLDIVKQYHYEPKDLTKAIDIILKSTEETLKDEYSKSY